MASSGTLSPSGGYGGRKLSFSWSLSSQSVTGNYSVISWSLSAVGGSSNWYYHYKEQIYVYGAYRYNNTSKTKRYTGTIASGSITIYHDSAGKGSFSASLYAAIYTSSQNQSGSSSWSLPDIPRVSDISVNKTTVPADGSTTITATATKKSSSFTDTITVSLGSYSKTVTSGTAFTIPLSWNNAITGTSATATATVTTKSGSTTIGSKSVTFTVTVPSSVKPSISSVSLSEAVSSVTTAFGNRYVKTLSQINGEISASGIYGSTISKYSTSLNGVTYSGKTFTSNVLTSSGELTVTTTVTDSRGRTATYEQTITVVDYYAPAITNMTYIPCDSAGAETSTGTYIKVFVSGKIAAVDNQNTRSLILKYKKANDVSYTTVTMTLSAYIFDDVSVLISGIDPTSTYEIVAELSDKLSTTSYTLSTGVPVLSRLAGGGGVRLFGEAESEGFWVGNIDMTITDDEYDELLTLLGGV